MPRKPAYTRNKNYGRKTVFTSTKRPSYGGSWFSVEGFSGKLTATKMLPFGSPKDYEYISPKFKLLGRKK